MDDVQVPAGPGIPHGLVVPSGELIEAFSHASGPGGQHVNTADSKVQLSLDLATTTAFSETLRARAHERLAHRLSGTVLTVSVQDHRSQMRNRTLARQRLAAILREALAPPIHRRATRPSRSSRLRRVAAERRRSQVKRNRRRPSIE